MSLLLSGLLVLVISGLLSFFTQKSSSLCMRIGYIGAAIGSLLALVPSILVLLGGPEESLNLAWSIPGGSFSIQLDALSSVFATILLGLSTLAAIYGSEYMSAYIGKRKLGAPWFFFNTLVASMLLVVLARNAILFLIAWEAMALASFFLVIFDSEKDEVRHAGLIYLIATHVGTAFLFVFFILLGSRAGSLDFDKFEALQGLSPAFSSTLFLLAIVGFGAKAGFLPFHVWLPEAHPAAPSHVSALMSGVMIKLGIYGLIRSLSFLSTPPRVVGLEPGGYRGRIRHLRNHLRARATRLQTTSRLPQC